MLKTLIQTVNFNVRPETLFSLYADPKKHSAATGGKVVVASRPGSKFDAFDGSLTGETLGVLRNRVFVQTWRADDWTPDQRDSVLTLIFEKHGRGARVTLIHANIPEEHYEGIRTGWKTYYWDPWRNYLSNTKRKR